MLSTSSGKVSRLKGIPHLPIAVLSIRAYFRIQELHEAGKIFLGRRSKWANLHLSTYMSGLTPDETKAITKLRNICQVYIDRHVIVSTPVTDIRSDLWTIYTTIF